MGFIDDQQDAVLHDAAYKEIVLRHGTKVTLDQVLETLLDLGWTPPSRSLRSRTKESPLKMASERLETCPSCKQPVNPVAAPALCRHSVYHCPFKALKS